MRLRAATRRGASAAELAFVLPVLALVALGAGELGRFGYHYIAVTNAARAGAEYGATNPYIAANLGTWTSQIQSVAQAELTNQTGCTPSNLTTVTTVTVESSGLRRVRVQATYTPFQTLISWPGMPTTLTLRSSAEVRSVR